MNTKIALCSSLFLVAPLLALACSASDGDQEPAAVGPGAGGASTGGQQDSGDTGGSDGGDTGGNSAGGGAGDSGGSSAGGGAGDSGGGDGCVLQLEGGSSAQTVELCSPEEGLVQHVRIAGLNSGSGFASTQFFVGFDEPPVGPQAPLEDDQLKVMLYSGTPNDIHISFGAESVTFTGDHSFADGTSTLCFDLHAGSEDRAPRVTLWVDGQRGAACDDVTTLTEASAYGVEDSWEGAAGPLALHKKMYLYQAGGIDADPEVTFRTQPVASCETHWEENTEWQRLCEPLGGAHHFRIEQAEVTAASSFFYLIVGEGDAPANNPASAEGDRKFIFTGGRANAAAGVTSWTYFRFSGETTAPTTYQTDDEEQLYVVGPSTVCVEVADLEEEARVIFWATGANGADCHDLDTLTLDSALYTNTWDEALATDLWNYIKTSNANASASKVVVSNWRLDD